MCAAAIIKRKRNWRHNLFYLSEKVTIAHGEKNQSPRDFMMPCHMTSRAHDMSHPIFGFCHGDCRTRDVFESSLLIVAVARIISSLSAEGQVQKIRKKTPSFDSDCPNFPRQVKNKTMSRDGVVTCFRQGFEKPRVCKFFCRHTTTLLLKGKFFTNFSKSIKVAYFPRICRSKSTYPRFSTFIPTN